MTFLAIIQARLGSTRLPGKCMQTVGGVPMVKRVWEAAKNSLADDVIVAWSERYADLDESNVLERFRRIALEKKPTHIIRLTSDCPLLTTEDINYAIREYVKRGFDYYNNQRDGHDVQIFALEVLFSDIRTSREHVIADFSTLPTGLSVNTKEDLQRVRNLCKTKQS